MLGELALPFVDVSVDRFDLAIVDAVVGELELVVADVVPGDSVVLVSSPRSKPIFFNILLYPL